MTSMLAMAHELVLAQIRAGQLSPAAMHHVLRETHTRLLALQAQEDRRSSRPISVRAAVSAPIHWKKSLTKHTVMCLECGASFKQLSLRHLKIHDLTPRAYRAKYGMPRRQPLAAKALTARRTQLAQEHRPWEKAPNYLKTQARPTPRRTRRRPPAAAR
jgi:predicted transcriptional regulator